MVKKYPIISLSNELRYILGHPPAPKKSTLKPYVYVVLIAGVALLVYFIVGTIKAFGIGSIIGGVFFSVLSLICLFLSWGCLSTIYDCTWGYRIKYLKWERTIHGLETNEQKRIEREHRIQNILTNRRPAENEDCDEFESAKKGMCEIWFYNKLKEMMESVGGEVYNNKKIYIYRKYGGLNLDLLEHPKYFYPDIAVFIRNLSLVFEIDDPYALDTRQPIHCNGMDDYRNKYLTSNRWEVIRFTEQQIVMHTDKCLETIRNTIDCILEGKCADPVPDSDGSWRTEQWDEANAKALSKRCYRESYLNNLE